MSTNSSPTCIDYNLCYLTCLASLSLRHSHMHTYTGIWTFFFSLIQRYGNDSCKRGSKVGTSQTGEEYIIDSKRQKLHNAVDVGHISRDVHAKEFSLFNSESVHEHQRCPNIKSLHTTVHEDTNGLFSCAFCHSSRTTEVRYASFSFVLHSLILVIDNNLLS